jgi:3-oxoacyl-[acyl-carrier-protein] synthase III
MHIVEQNVEDDNIEELIMKQANTNMAKQILKKLEMRMESSQNIPNNDKE